MTHDLVQLADDPGVLEQVRDPGQYIVLACERAKTWLTNALDHGDIDQLVEVKSQAEAIRVYTTQKQIGKDAELAAAEVVRRAERGIGLAIRRGQQAGEVASKTNNSSGPTKPYTRQRHGRTESVQAHGRQQTRTLVSPRLYFTNTQERAETYAMTDDVSNEQFDDAIDDAKREKDLSRANVARKTRAKRDAAETQRAAATVNDGVPDGKDRTPKAARRRRELLRDYVARSMTSDQIAARLDITAEHVRQMARDEGVAITADKFAGRTPRIDPNRIVGQIVTDLEVTDDEFALIDYSALDRAELPQWISSLTRSLKRLRRLKTDLERELNRGQD